MDAQFVIVFCIVALVLLIIALTLLSKGIFPQKVELVFYHLNIKIKSMSLEIKQFLDANLSLVDHATQAPIAATFSNVKIESSDPSIFTTDSDVDADGTLDVVGVSAGEATLTATADVSYTDANTGQPVTATKSVAITVTVTAPPPEAEETDLVVTLSDAKPIPTPAA